MRILGGMMLNLLVSVVWGLVTLPATQSAGDLEPTFGRCCAYGANWGREARQCSSFPAPVTGIPSEHQSICITTAGICCLRYFRDEQCQKGKQAAQVGQDCVSSNDQGGEYFKDCCQGCKLGLVSGSMGSGCIMRFKFGFPWDTAYLHCCHQAISSGVTPDLTNTNPSFGAENLYPGVTPPLQPDSAESEDLCAKFPGKLCAHVCVPTPGSYRCQCRDGFALSVDGKTCIQDSAADRCAVNNPCDHICQDTGVSVECSCHLGFKLALDQRSCEDVNECLDSSHNCNWTTHFCVNTRGGYTCQEKTGPGDCIAGYKYSAQQDTCVDIDECAERIDSCEWSTQTCVNSVGSYRCIDQEPTCNFGFRYNEGQRACVDIDECEEGRDICNQLTESCVNTMGEYWCAPQLKPLTQPATATASTPPHTSASTSPPVPPTLPYNPIILDCPAGKMFDLITRTCVDIDECATQPCSRNEFCVNTQGSYRCDCQLGFEKDSEQPDGDCVDINECEDGKHNCGLAQRCDNTLGSYVCTNIAGCTVGYNRNQNSGQCEDINECQVGQHSCSSSQRCDNTVGSYVCIRIAGCGTGYTLNQNTGQCDDDDECELNTHDCGQLGPKYRCVNIKGSFRCQKKTCPSHQLLNEAGVCVNLTCSPGFMPFNSLCVDINECAEGSPCQRNEQCINNIGSFSCRPLIFCRRGYKMNDLGTQCVDVDECADGTHECAGNQECVNRQGSYLCRCPEGFRLNSDRQCQDINECETSYACGRNADCVNTQGSYRCSCKQGFREADNGRTCLDVDECTEIPGICHHNCINIWGTYQCTCRAGYTLGSDNRTCNDVNECEEFKRGRLCIGLCVNTAGSFSCSCPDGYELGADGRTCKDINECETGNVCRGVHEVCVNTRGGHKCNTITCPSDYIHDTQYKNRCKKVSPLCRAGDIACQRKPISYSYNFLPLISNMSLPSLGQVDLFTMRGPLWPTTTVEFELELEEAQAPATKVEAATRDYFYLKRTAFNQAVISLVKPIIGPQEVQLVLNTKLYQHGRYSGTAVSKLLLYVSEYNF